ncbi:MAG: beta-N-acetylhexosaminidase [Bdellovibrionales bacterium]|nr:beta-N-acetylhexosaminidase [Bdellovibrionales bacterium]
MMDYRHWGDFFIVGLEGPSLTSREASLLAALSPLGIILFAKNFADDADRWPEILARLIADAKEATGRPSLLVSIDHEGGRVHRFPSRVTRFPYARAWAHQAAAVGRAMGRELHALGFNLNFAPVLDVHAEPQNQVIGDRAFATDPADVPQPALAFLRAMEAEGVLGCIKHFPGHGATVADSHFELPHLDVSLDVFRSRELHPFIELLKHEPQLLMSAHVRYLALDSARPATLSRRILHELLRGELQYRGVVVSDDLEMAALQHVPPGERAVLAVTAGIDLLLEGNPKDGPALEYAWEMAEGLEAAGLGATAEIRCARERLATLVGHVDRLQAAAPRRDVAVLNCSEHQELCTSVTEG